MIVHCISLEQEMGLIKQLFSRSDSWKLRENQATVRSFSRSVGQYRPAGRSSKIDRDRPTSTDREHYLERNCTCNFSKLVTLLKWHGLSISKRCSRKTTHHFLRENEKTFSLKFPAIVSKFTIWFLAANIIGLTLHLQNVLQKCPYYFPLFVLNKTTTLWCKLNLSYSEVHLH